MASYRTPVVIKANWRYRNKLKERKGMMRRLVFILHLCGSTNVWQTQSAQLSLAALCSPARKRLEVQEQRTRCLGGERRFTTVLRAEPPLHTRRGTLAAFRPGSASLQLDLRGDFKESTFLPLPVAFQERAQASFGEAAARDRSSEQRPAGRSDAAGARGAGAGRGGGSSSAYA
ncbi:uncharacterized protein LOC144291629 [Canis aureus]